VVFSSQKRISGAEVEMRVRPGDDVTLHCDCVMKGGFYLVWFRNCSHENQPRLMISIKDFIGSSFPRYSFVFNKSTNTHDLLIKNITESDQGLYYCALHETKITDNKGGLIQSSEVYHYGNRSTRFSVLEKASPYVTVSVNTATLCVSEGSVSWRLVLSVCAVCVLLSSLLSSICVYCLCTNTTKGTHTLALITNTHSALNTGTRVRADLTGSDRRTTLRREEVGEDEVCYASLDIQKLERKKMKRKKRIQHSDFSTYSE
ncbi:hypothetical protein QTP70_030787, partial [Hemibagrus guttatus]